MKPQRVLFFDIETTGLDLEKNRIIELGIVESIDGEITNNNLHLYFNPEGTPIEPGATKVHNIKDDDLKDKKTFKEHSQYIIDYIYKSHSMIAHNAIFDVSFLNKELALAGYKDLTSYCRSIKDSIALARKLYPNRSNSLSSLCKRLKISLETREFHGALIDANLLYLAFFGMINDNPDNKYVRYFLKDIRKYKDYDLDKTTIVVKHFQTDKTDYTRSSKIHSIVNIIRQIKLLELDLLTK